MKKIRKIYSFFRGFLPSKLPRSLKDFDKFSQSIFETYNIPATDGYRHAVATMIMHLDQHKTSHKKISFVRAIRKAMSNEVAFKVLADLREKEKKATADKLLETTTAGLLDDKQSPAKTIAG